MKVSSNVYPLTSSVKRALAEVLAEGSELAVVVAVSGGEDSHVLLHALSVLREDLPLRLTICHLDHAIRPESADDAAFVERLAQRYSTDFRLLRADMRPVKENVEAWGRRIRYEFFEQVRSEINADCVVTAHHKNDEVETLLFRLLSGRLISDTRAIARWDRVRRVLRPLLEIPKVSIREYSKHYGLAYVSDSTNDDVTRTRNLIRHRLLPQLEREFNPSLVETLSDTSKRLTEDESLLEEQSRKLLPELDCGRSLRQVLKSTNGPLRWRLISLLAKRELGPDGARIGYSALSEVVEKLLDGDGSERRIELGLGYTCDVTDSGVRFGRLLNTK